EPLSSSPRTAMRPFSSPPLRRFLLVFGAALVFGGFTASSSRLTGEGVPREETAPRKVHPRVAAGEATRAEPTPRSPWHVPPHVHANVEGAYDDTVVVFVV